MFVLHVCYKGWKIKKQNKNKHILNAVIFGAGPGANSVSNEGGGGVRIVCENGSSALLRHGFVVPYLEYWK